MNLLHDAIVPSSSRAIFLRLLDDHENLHHLASEIRSRFGLRLSPKPIWDSLSSFFLEIICSIQEKERWTCFLLYNFTSPCLVTDYHIRPPTYCSEDLVVYFHVRDASCSSDVANINNSKRDLDTRTCNASPTSSPPVAAAMNCLRAGYTSYSTSNTITTG